MKASEALIAWTPAHYGPSDRRTAPAGSIKIGYIIGEDERDWSEPYPMTGGAAYAHVRELKGDAAALQLFLDWHAIVVRDGVDPQKAHEEFLKIDEYAQYIAPDIQGARDKEPV